MPESIPPAMTIDSTLRKPAPRSLRRRISHAFYQLSFRNKLVVMSTAVSLVCLLIAGVLLTTSEVLQFRQAMLSRTIALADVTAANSEASVAFEDPDSARLLLQNLRSVPEIEQAQILLPRGEQVVPFASFSHDSRPLVMPEQAPRIGHRFLPDHLEVIRPILQEQMPIGYLYLRVGLGQLEDTLRRFLLTIGGLVVLNVLVAWLLSYRWQRVITRPVTELVNTARQISRERDYSVRATVLADDELGSLTQAFNAMLDEVQAHDAARERIEAQMRQLNESLEAKVRARTAEIEARNRELNRAIETLRQAQSQLVESEKMAALGGLVAGVAHEINTPLGMCVTMVSHVGEQLQGLRRAYTDGMRRSDLVTYMEATEQSIEIIETNLNRAADLVRSFKLVAVDQGSEARRRFLVAEYLGEVLLSLRPQLRKRGAVTVELDCPPTLELDSYPGVLAQIVTNLTVNATIHAFAPGLPGKLRIACRLVGDWFEMEFTDDGAGMSEDVRLHVFDPFFTTRRGEGGSGLGLHIVYNQVTQTLRGTISCRSAPGQGSCFTIRFPARV